MKTDLDAQLGPLLIQHAPLHVAVVDRDRRILRASTHFEQAFGACVGLRCHVVCKGREERCDPCPAQAVFDTGSSAPCPQSLRDERGAEVVCEVTAVALEGGPEHGPLAMIIAEDRTQVASLQEELAQAERLANVGLTAAGLAHTIKNILGGMEGAMYTVDTGLEKGDDARVRLGWEMVSTYIGQVSSLVLNLLDYTRPSRADRQQQAPGEMVREVVDLYDDRALLIGITLRAEVSGDLQPIWMDSPVIHACLANLVTNALDACSWDPDETKTPEIVVSVEPCDGGGARFTVCDNGTGISDENQRRILAASFTTKGIRGTGLGLLLTRQAVEQHQGQIGFFSEQGRGSRFWIELPAGEAPAPDPGSSP